MARPRKHRSISGRTALPALNIARLRLRLRGWFLRTLRMDTSGEYGKMKSLLRAFLLQAERNLAVHLWERATEVAVEEALQHLGLRWGAKFRQPLHMEVRVTDTHLKFSVTALPDRLRQKKKVEAAKQKQRREAAADRSLYVVRRLSNRLHIGPAGRQLVFWQLLRRPVLHPGGR